MAKRLQDTEMLSDKWYRKLSPQIKLLWKTLLDECDMAGVWKVDLEHLEYCLQWKYSGPASLAALDGRVVEFDDGKKWMIVKFTRYQYGVLKPAHRVHAYVIRALKSHGIDPAPFCAEEVVETKTSFPDIVKGLNKVLNPEPRVKDTDIDIDTISISEGESERGPDLASVCASPALPPLPKGEPVPLGPSECKKLLEGSGAKIFGMAGMEPWMGLCKRQGGVYKVCDALDRMPPLIREDVNKCEAWIINDRKTRADRQGMAAKAAETRQKAELEREAAAGKAERDRASREPLERIAAYLADPSTPDEFKKRVIGSVVCSRSLQGMAEGRFTDLGLQCFFSLIPSLRDIAHPVERVIA